MLLARAQIDQPQFCDFRLGGCGLHQHRGVVDVAGQQVVQHLRHRDFRAGAKLSQRLFVRERAALATSEMVAGKDRAFGAGKGF